MSRAIEKDILYPDESRLIYDAAHEVYNNFGGSFKESVVDRALTIALEKRDLNVDNQKRIDIYFENQKVGTYVPDKIVANKILIELKCKAFITKEDERQFWHYLKASDFKLGFLINFGSEKLTILRRIYDLARDNSRVSSLLPKSNESRLVASTSED